MSSRHPNKLSVEVTALLQAVEITRLNKLLKEMETKLHTSQTISTKRSNLMKGVYDSEESSVVEDGEGGEMANIMVSYKRALGRNDELLSEIEVVRKSNIFIEA